MRLKMMAIALLAAFALAGTASAQQATTRVNIPFDFVVMGKTMPAGDYRVYTDVYSHVLTLEGINKIAKASVLYNASGERVQAPKLQFESVNGVQVLLSAAPGNERLELLRGKQKKQVAKSEQPATSSGSAGN